MLEIRHLTKVYDAKGVAVRALDDVSIRFPERGMVFLLGKSGSGKSTLLNLCGGLDSPDEGEVIIKGRSSKDFSQSDFDSYRNTFIGFVFQEYNILNEFTVEDNIALALELQGKSKNKQQVRDILAQVELEQFAKRKPNTLSGGQKQRVAIARALVKNPEIIMADEPTGALDSNTGKQVFDTLKKLSEEKLVIVVSHDREFAEIYGDRIIELKDGKVISDVTKAHIAAQQTSKNLRFIGDNTVSVQNGAALSDEDLRLIRDFLAHSNGNVVITNGVREISDFRKAARIDANDARETFRDTKQQPAARTYAPEEAKFIRSHLPARHAIRIGASGMKLKPIRLLFTILLSLISFTMFGLFSTFTFFNQKDVMYNTYLTSGYDTLRFEKYYNYVSVSYENGVETYRSDDTEKQQTPFTQEEFDKMQEQYGDGLGIFNYSVDNSGYTSFNIDHTYSSTNQYYVTTLYGFAELPEDSSYWADLLQTDTDLSALGDSDIVISTYLFDSLKESGLRDENDTKIALENYSDIIGKTLSISTANQTLELTVKGVFRYDPPQDFDGLKNKTESNYSLQDKFSKTLRSGIYLTPLVSSSFYAANKASASSQTNFESEYLQSSLTMTYLNGDNEGTAEYYNILAYSENVRNNVHLFGGRTTLGDNEIVMDISRVLFPAVQPIFYEFDKTGYDPLLHDFNNLITIVATGEYTDYNTKQTETVSAAIRNQAFALFDALCQQVAETDAQKLSVKVTDPAGDEQTFTVAGFYFDCNKSDPMFSQSVVDSLVASFGYADSQSWKQETKYVVPANAKYTAVVFLFPSDTGLLRSAVDNSNVVADDDSFYALASPLSDSVETVSTMIEQFETVFLWIGIVMAVFSMLLLFNFISVSISGKKKEIGILRAVGARSTDVFKIFFSESAIIAGICFVLSMIASFVVCFLLNKTFINMVGAAILVFGPLSWLILLGIAAVTSFIATFLPVYTIARKKPVESIRAL